MCRNWVLTRARLIPGELQQLLNPLGIPFDLDTEVYHNGRLASGLHSYAGWYHFVGRILAGERENSPPLSFAPFSVYFASNCSLLPDAFAGQPVVQLEFTADVPWLSDIAEPS
jgi:hypothetical protein